MNFKDTAADFRSVWSLDRDAYFMKTGVLEMGLVILALGIGLGIYVILSLIAPFNPKNPKSAESAAFYLSRLREKQAQSAYVEEEEVETTKDKPKMTDLKISNVKVRMQKIMKSNIERKKRELREKKNEYDKIDEAIAQTSDLDHLTPFQKTVPECQVTMLPLPVEDFKTYCVDCKEEIDTILRHKSKN